MLVRVISLSNDSVLLRIKQVSKDLESFCLDFVAVCSSYCKVNFGLNSKSNIIILKNLSLSLSIYIYIYILLKIVSL